MGIKEQIFKQSIEIYGKEAQSRQAMEECAELIQAVNKMLRYEDRPAEPEYYANLVEEIADVEIMLYQLKVMFNVSDDEVFKVKIQKTKREQERLENHRRKQKYELTKFEHELLVFLQTEGYNYIAKDSSGEFAPPRLVACDKKLPYHNLSGIFTTYKSNAFHMEGPFGKLFKFVWGGNQFGIQELLENCEVTDHDS